MLRNLSLYSNLDQMTGDIILYGNFTDMSFLENTTKSIMVSELSTSTTDLHSIYNIQIS